MTKKTDTIWGLTHQGETSLQLGNYMDAVRCFTEVIERKPSAWVYAHRGQAFLSSKFFQEALDDFQRAIEISRGTNSNYAWAYAHMGETLRLMGKQYKPQAREAFTRAIEINPNYTWAIAHRGASYDLHKDFELAIEDFDKAIALYPKYAWALAFRSTVYLKKGEPYRAYFDLLHAIQLDNTIMGDTLNREIKEVLREIISTSTNSKITTPLPD